MHRLTWVSDLWKAIIAWAATLWAVWIHLPWAVFAQMAAFCLSMIYIYQALKKEWLEYKLKRDMKKHLASEKEL